MCGIRLDLDKARHPTPQSAVQRLGLGGSELGVLVLRKSRIDFRGHRGPMSVSLGSESREVICKKTSPTES